MDTQTTPVSPPSLWRRIAPVLGLLCLSPLVAEFLLGNISISALAIIIVFIPFYGGGAVLVREVARRTGRGWPTILVLALAYAIFEEGLTIQTLFNPHYFGLSLLKEAYIPSLGIGMWWTLFVLTLHTVWSISVPIAIVEACVPDRATKPWLGNVGLGVISVLFVLGAYINFKFTQNSQKFMATPAQLIDAAAVMIALIVVAFAVGRPRPRRDGRVPNPWVVGIFALLMGSAFMTLRGVLGGWAIVTAYVLLFAVVAFTVAHWAIRTEWGEMHKLALAGGALLTYAWHSFIETPVFGAKGMVDLIGNTVLTLAAILLLWCAVRTVTLARRPEPTQ